MRRRRIKLNEELAGGAAGVFAIALVLGFIFAVFSGLSLGILVGAQLIFGVPATITFGKVAGGALILFAISVVN